MRKAIKNSLTSAVSFPHYDFIYKSIKNREFLYDFFSNVIVVIADEDDEKEIVRN